MPAFFKDLIHRGSRSVLLHDAQAFFGPLIGTEAYLLCDPLALRRRQDLFRDLETQSALTEIFRTLLEMLDGLSYYMTLSGDLRSENEAIIYSILKLNAFTNFIDFADRSCETDLVPDAFISGDLRAFFSSVHECRQSEPFRGIKRWLDQLQFDLNNIRSVTLGANLDAQMRIREVGLVSFNAHPFVSSSLLDSAFRDEAPPKDYKTLAALGIRELKQLRLHQSIAVNREFFAGVNTLFQSSAKSIRRHIADAFMQDVRALLAMKEDLVFLVKAADLTQKLRKSGLRLTFPKIAERTVIRGLWNPDLLEKCSPASIVTNDVLLDESHRIYILTGPNSGGKSVFLHSVGIAQILFQLGLPVPAAYAEMRTYTAVASLFVQETVQNTDSRLVGEVLRLKETLEHLDRNSLLLMDETFSSTSAYDGVFLAQALIRYLEKLGCSSFYVTHLHELAGHLPYGEEGSCPSLHFLTAQNSNGQRTYKIIPHDGSENESSLAKDIVIENGLGFLFEGGNT